MLSLPMTTMFGKQKAKADIGLRKPENAIDATMQEVMTQTTRRSTSGSASNFLDYRLVICHPQKEEITAILASTTKAEYIALSRSCAQSSGCDPSTPRL
ncbi:hypothetical protein Tco_0474209 [Tanacetum coccineum]